MPLIMGSRSYIVGELDNYFDGDIKVGAYTSISRNVCFLCGWGVHHGSVNGHVSNFHFNHVDRGPIIIGNDVWIGTNAIIMAGVQIHDGAIVGAGAVVTKNVEPYQVVAGNPAKHIKYRFDDSQVKSLQRIKWWQWSEEIIKERLTDAWDVNDFCSQYDPEYKPS